MTGVETLSSWYAEFEPLLSEKCTKHCLTISEYESAWIRFETKSSLNSLVVWNHQLAIEFQVTDAHTGETKLLLHGPSNSLSELTTKLSHVTDWLKEHG